MTILQQSIALVEHTPWFTMDDKQIARLFDSRGSIYIDNRGRLGLALDSTVYRILSRLQWVYGGFITKLLPARDGNRAIWLWNLDEKRCGDFLGRMLPLAGRKKPQIEAAITYILTKKDMRGMDTGQKIWQMAYRTVTTAAIKRLDRKPLKPTVYLYSDSLKS